LMSIDCRLTGSRWDIRWVSGDGKTRYFVYLAWRLWKSVLRLAVRGNSISGRVVRRQRVSVFDKHRLPWIGSRWDIRWVSGGGKTRFFCVFSVAVMAKCFEACG
jgi:hypothetical protein